MCRELDKIVGCSRDRKKEYVDLNRLDNNITVVRGMAVS